MAPSPAQKNMRLAIYFITILTGFPTNLLALHALIRKLRHKATPNAILLFNLTISDLSFLTFLPFKVAEICQGQWKMPSFLCPLSGLFYFSTIYSSTLFLTAVSVERFLGVAYPLKYKLYRKPSYAAAISGFLWVCSFAHCSIVYVTEYNHDANTSMRIVCFDNFTEKQMEVLGPFRLELGIVLFCFPFLITCFCYCSFIRILVSSPHIHREKKQRAIGLVITTLSVFAICFAPYNASHLVGFVQKKNVAWRDEALLLSTLNACLDPIIFYFSSTAVQHSCRSCLVKLRLCKTHSTLQKIIVKPHMKTSPPDNSDSQIHSSKF
ncbi:free fatty acid receptor 2 [Xenopus laevis]|uniref:Free fatty acid receptor 2 n=1 Tax=Xenopus laevis TaxID=8355 RepID=A0A8J1LDJ3_XENLA|nr:free fatty acid receptor 2 [Xenopus laevis]XP_041427634.1 free fatty acid receptor 2 [Xenopus laevis]